MYTLAMKRLNFHLSEEQIARLHTMARQHHVSASELVRRFIDQGLARLGAPSELGDSVVVADVHDEIAALREEVRALRTRIVEKDYHES